MAKNGDQFSTHPIRDQPKSGCWPLLHAGLLDEIRFGAEETSLPTGMADEWALVKQGVDIILAACCAAMNHTVQFHDRRLERHRGFGDKIIEWRAGVN